MTPQYEKMTKVIRISVDVYNAIPKIQKAMYDKFGIMPTTRQVVDLAISDLYEKEVKKD